MFVSHDGISEQRDRVVVFYAGEMVESGPAAEIVERPRHPYTQALLRVASVGDFRRRELQVIAGQQPQVGPLAGCQRRALPGRGCRRAGGTLRSVGPQHQAC